MNAKFFKNKPGPGRRHRGFTLVELMVVLSIIGILAAVALPSYQAYIYRAKAAEVILVMDKIKTVLADLQTQTGSTLGTPIKLSDNPDGAGDKSAMALAYCVVTQTHCVDGYKVVPGLSRGELEVLHLGVRLVVSSGYMHSDAPGQYKISINEATDLTRGNPALRATAQQIMLAVHHEMKPYTHLDRIGHSDVYLYFNISGK